MKLAAYLFLAMIYLNNIGGCASIDESDSSDDNLWQEQDYDPEYNEKNKKKNTWDWLF